MSKNVERKPNQYFEYYTDDSGVVRRTAWVLCPRCNKDMPETDYQEHLTQCKQLTTPTIGNHTPDTELHKPISNKTNVRAAVVNSPKQRIKSRFSVTSSSTSISTQTTKRQVKNLRDYQRDTHSIEHTSRELMVCPLCPSKVRADRLGSHIQKIHKHKGGRELRACPHCPSKVRADKLDAHIQKVHPNKIKTSMSKFEHVESSSAQKKKRKIRQAGHSKPYLSEAFSQSFDEPFDGSKGWHRRRENGRFGSHPLFDDYGDESSA